VLDADHCGQFPDRRFNSVAKVARTDQFDIVQFATECFDHSARALLRGCTMRRHVNARPGR
jgi:hypothetical protein